MKHWTYGRHLIRQTIIKWSCIQQGYAQDGSAKAEIYSTASEKYATFEAPNIVWCSHEASLRGTAMHAFMRLTG